MSTSGTIFNGTSRYSSDFQTLIDRAVAIASLPLTQLTTGKSTLEKESTAFATLDGKFTALQTAIASLENGSGLSSYGAWVSNGTILSVSLSAGAAQASYAVEVTGLGSSTSTLSKNGLTTVSDPATQNISPASSFTLTLNSAPHTLTPAANTLDALVAAINDSGLDVEASIVNVGSTASLDYRLSIQSTKLDNVSIQLDGGAGDLMDTLAAGAKAAYKVNGMATAIQTDSRTVTLAPGVTATLLAESATGVATTVTVARNGNAISDALASFAGAYNATLSALDAHRGNAGGALSGQSIISTLSQVLRDTAQYSDGSGTIASLTDLGLTFDDKGTLSLDTVAFLATSSSNFDALLTFLGSATGGGFLKSATDLLNGLEDSTSGAIKTSIASLDDQIKSQDDRIAAEQDRIDQYHANLVAQMSAADAMIAALEQQATYLNDLFESMRLASQMYSA